jgi:hypothetical protein
MRVRNVPLSLLIAFSLAGSALGEGARELQAIPNWSAPPYWAPPVAPSAPDLATERGTGDYELGFHNGLTNNEGSGRVSLRSESRVPLIVAAPVPLPFVAIAPCRQYNSLNTSPLLQAVNRPVTLTGTPCNIPANAVAVSANLTVFNISGATGNAVFKLDTVSPPATAWINYPPTEIQRSNAGIMALNGSGQIWVQVAQGGGQVDFVVDVNGYYADIGSPRAWAMVDPATPTSFVRVKNFTAVARPSTGLYCLTPAAGIDPLATIAQVTVEWGSSSGSELLAFANDGTHNCPAGQLEVRTYKTFAALALSNNVGFYVSLP